MEEKMVQMMGKLPELLNQLGEKLGVAGAKIWEWALLDVKVDIWQNILFIIGFLLFIYLEYKVVKFINTKGNLDHYYEFCIFFGAIGIILTALGSITFIISILHLPSLIINPEWEAFQKIMEQISYLK